MEDHLFIRKVYHIPEILKLFFNIRILHKKNSISTFISNTVKSPSMCSTNSASSKGRGLLSIVKKTLQSIMTLQQIIAGYSSLISQQDIFKTIVSQISKLDKLGYHL